jgi:phospholipid-binding lipoprotein MlaA
MKKGKGLFSLIVLILLVAAVPLMAADLSTRSEAEFKAALIIPSIPPADLSGVQLYAETDTKEQDTYAQALGDEEFLENEDEDYLEEDTAGVKVVDPFEPLNRFFFDINDKLYFWVLKPVAKGYSKIVPEKVRISVKNVFNNISTPVRVVNNLLQGKVEHAGDELVRFGVNSTVGVLGLFDYAKTELEIPMRDEDFGQTLGVWGLAPGFYINWPILGPSTLRDSIGYAGDYFLEPVNYIEPFIDQFAIKVGDTVNRASLSIGEYEEIKKDALDPYAAVRDIYIQYRKSKLDR